MIIDLSGGQQVDFDERVMEVKERASRNWRVIEKGAGSMHFTNHGEAIAYKGARRAYVKTPKVLSSILFYGECIRRGLRGFKPVWRSTKARVASEIFALELLGKEGANVPSLVFTNIEGVIATEYLPHAKPYLDLRACIDRSTRALCEQLEIVHQAGMHGDASVSNSFLYGGRWYFVDFDRFTPTKDPALLAQDIERLTISVARHDRPTGYRRAREMVMDFYRKGKVKDMCRNKEIEYLAY